MTVSVIYEVHCDHPDCDDYVEHTGGFQTDAVVEAHRQGWRSARGASYPDGRVDWCPEHRG